MTAERVRTSRDSDDAWMSWAPRAGARRVRTIDAHAGGEPLRVILDGVPMPPGDTVADRRLAAMECIDDVRRALMWEPRGHADMYGALLVPSGDPRADLGVLFLHNEGFSTMCGHGIIALVTVALETGLLPAEAADREIAIETPAGLVRARAHLAGHGRPTSGEGASSSGGRGTATVRVEHVAFRNVPSFVAALDREVEVPGVGRVRYDLAYGGAFYAYVDATSIGVGLQPADIGALVDAGRAIKHTVAVDPAVEHPLDASLGFLYGVIFTGPPESGDADGRNVCVFADGEVDRSPTGTGVSGRAALLHARGDLGIGETFVTESIVGSRFSVTPVAEMEVEGRAAIVPEVEGSARITGRHEFVLDPDDPLGAGFLVR